MRTIGETTLVEGEYSLTMTMRLPGGSELSTPSFTGNSLWQISDGNVCLGYNSLDDAMLDFVFRLSTASGTSTNRCVPDRFRTSYGRLFHPLERIEHVVAFRKSLAAAIRGLQEAEEFCGRNSTNFTMQGTGIHRFNDSARRYEYRFGGMDVTELLAAVREGTVRMGEGYDVFISHASEDKDSCVRPLAEELRAVGLDVWYDDFELRLGDSLRRSIDRGIASSRCGIVVISRNFINKNWPQYELDGIVARLVEGESDIIPLWYEIDKHEVLAFSPSLADRVAVQFSLDRLGEIVEKIVARLRSNRRDAAPEEERRQLDD